MNFSKSIQILLLSLAVTCPVAAQAYEVSFEQDSSVPLVYVNVGIKAGAAADPEHQSGLMNFMGEMLLRGTSRHTKEEIDSMLDQMGAHLEVETRAESMILRGAVLKSQLSGFLNILNEILTDPNFPEGEIRKLKSEIISGILEELGRDPSLAARKFNAFLFQNHPYGNPVLGKLKDVKAFDRGAIAAYYARWVTDPNLLIIGTGDASSAQIEAWAKSLAAARPGSSSTPSMKIQAPKDPSQRRLVIVDKPDRTQTQINFGQVGVLGTDKDFFPLYLGNHAFGGGSFSARLMVEIRVKRGWSYGAGSYFRLGTQPRSWQVHLFPAAKDTPQALALSLKMVQDLREHGITQAEFDFSQRSLVNSSGFMYNTPKKRVENKLIERTLDLPDGFMKSYGPSLKKVTLSEVNAALKGYLKPDHETIVVLGTAKNLKDKLAQAAGVPAGKVEVVPYTEE